MGDRPVGEKRVGSISSEAAVATLNSCAKLAEIGTKGGCHRGETRWQWSLEARSRVTRRFAPLAVAGPRCFPALAAVARLVLALLATTCGKSLKTRTKTGSVQLPRHFRRPMLIPQEL